jgi:DnaK suppressor protein
LSKTTAHKTPAKKPAAKKPAASAKKSAPATKNVSPKPGSAKASATASRAASGKAGAKGGAPAPEKGVKSKHAAVAKTSHAPQAKAAKVATLAAPARPAAPKPVKPKSAPVLAGVTPAPAPGAASVPVPAKRPPSSRASARAAATPAQAPLPPPTSRFADRFAPPRPPTRQMAQVEVDTPRRVQVSDPKLANAWKSKAGRDMTEAEVLAMPDSEYMNDKQLEFFRYTLQALKNSLLSNAGETTEHLREDTSIVPDPADRATIEEEHALELRTRDRERKLLKKITQSLSRIEAGEYGFCDETGEPIGLGRLIARPTATLSLEAQQRRELKQKMFGD